MFHVHLGREGALLGSSVEAGVLQQEQAQDTTVSPRAGIALSGREAL